MVFWSVLLSVSLALPLMAHADDVMLAPGRSITFIDVEQPEVRVVVSAPADAELNLSRLMASVDGRGLSALATSVQVRGAEGIRMEEDGSLILGGPAANAPAASRPIPLEGGVIVLSQGKFTVYRDGELAASATGALEIRPAPHLKLDPARDPTPTLSMPQAPAGPAAPSLPSAPTITAGTGAIAVPQTLSVQGNISVQSWTTFSVGAGSVSINSSGSPSLNVVGNTGTTLITGTGSVQITGANGTQIPGNVSVTTTGAPASSAPTFTGR